MKKRRFTHKAAAWLLAFAMVIGVLPVYTAPAAQAADPRSGVMVEYNFGTCTDAWAAEYNTGSGYIISDIMNYEHTDGNWEYFAEQKTAGVMNAYRNQYVKWSIWGGGKPNWTAFKIKVPKAGSYTAKLEYQQYSGNTETTQLYILPGNTAAADIDTAVAAATSLGNPQFKTTQSGLVPASATLNDITLTAGEHILVFRPGSAGSHLQYINKFILDGRDPVKTIEAELKQGTIAANTSGDIVITRALTAGGTDADISKATITYKSNDESIATVSPTGIVVGVKQGTTTVEVTATVGDVEAKTTVEINVGPAAEKVLSGVLTEYNFGTCSDAWAAKYNTGSGYLVTDIMKYADTDGNWEY